MVRNRTHELVHRMLLSVCVVSEERRRHIHQLRPCTTITLYSCTFSQLITHNIIYFCGGGGGGGDLEWTKSIRNMPPPPLTPPTHGEILQQIIAEYDPPPLPARLCMFSSPIIFVFLYYYILRISLLLRSFTVT